MLEREQRRPSTKDFEALTTALVSKDIDTKAGETTCAGLALKKIGIMKGDPRYKILFARACADIKSGKINRLKQQRRETEANQKPAQEQTTKRKFADDPRLLANARHHELRFGPGEDNEK
ncbi:MAG: hypothetical protein ABIH21_00510 [Patescibacteria group bacterium]